MTTLFPTRLAGLLVLASGVVSCGAPGETRDAVWSYISPAIIQPNCATSSCHSRNAAVAGLDFSTIQDGYDSLTDLHTKGMMIPMHPAPRNLVVPGNPDQSRVVRMLHGDGANRMPPDRPLSIADVKLIESWILRGANND